MPDVFHVLRTDRDEVKAMLARAAGRGRGQG